MTDAHAAAPPDPPREQLPDADWVPGDVPAADPEERRRLLRELVLRALL